jgi:hypothetical protein
MPATAREQRADDKYRDDDPVDVDAENCAPTRFDETARMAMPVRVRCSMN